MTNGPDGKRDFFVSFNKIDRAWATWIAWVLEEAGYSVWFQDWDFRGNFAEHMNRAHDQAHRTLAVLSDHYFGSDFTFAEWSARFAQDPAAREDRLIPVKVGSLKGESILVPIVHADLTSCDEAEGQQRLLGRVKKALDPTYRDKPKSRPGFPGSPPRQVPSKPDFPSGVLVESNDTFDVFLSHAHVDAALVERMGARLADEGKLNVWLDQWALVPGEGSQHHLARIFDKIRCCAICVGNQTPENWFCEEIEKSLGRQSRDSSFRVIPVILPGGTTKFVDSFPELRTWVDFSGGFENGSAFHLLLSGIKGVPPGRYVPKSCNGDSISSIIDEKLLKLKEYRHRELIDEVVALEYQRILLDKLIG